jgi:hypothetical protein
VKKSVALAIALVIWLGESNSAGAVSSENIVFSAMERKGCTVSGQEYFNLGIKMGKGISYAYRFYLKHINSGRLVVNNEKDTVTLKKWGKCK